MMVRKGSADAAALPGFLILAEAPGHGYVVQWDANGDGRLDANSAPSNQGLGTAAYPSWLRLVRSGTSYTGYYFTDGTTWVTIARVSVPGAAEGQGVRGFAPAPKCGTRGEVHFAHLRAGWRDRPG